MDTPKHMPLEVPEEVERLLEARRILSEDVLGTIDHAETTGEKFTNAVAGRSLAFWRPGTGHVLGGVQPGGRVVPGPQRLLPPDGDETGDRVVSERTASRGESEWICNRCGVPVEVQKVRLQYRGSIFALDVPACPRCGMVLIDEELATGRMAEAEQVLEDK